MLKKNKKELRKIAIANLRTKKQKDFIEGRLYKKSPKLEADNALCFRCKSAIDLSSNNNYRLKFTGKGVKRVCIGCHYAEL